MPGEVLHVFQRNSLDKKSVTVVTRNECGERRLGKVCIAHPAFDHPADVAGGHAVRSQHPGTANNGPKHGRVIRGSAKGGRIEIVEQEALQVVADGDFAGLAALVEKPQTVLVTRVEEIGADEVRRRRRSARQCR